MVIESNTCREWRGGGILRHILFWANPHCRMDLKELQRSEAEGSSGHHPWEKARFSAVFSCIQQFSGVAHARFFDIGCGDTYFLQRLAEQLPQASFVGVDTAFDAPTLTRLQETVAKKNIRLFGSIDALPTDATPADVVFLMDVLEHVEDDVSFLQMLEHKGVIGPQTRLVITVPAFQKLFSSHDVWLGHFRRYTLARLHALAQARSYQTLTSSYLFASLLLPRMMEVVRERVLSRRRDTVQGVGAWRERKIFDACVAWVLTMDARILLALSRGGIRLPGLSCIVVLQKI